MNLKLLTIFLTLSLTVISIPASAHEIQTDSNLSALMHIEPSDIPVVGQESKFYFTFNGEHEKFDKNECLCSVIISKDGKTIFSNPAYVDHQESSIVNGPAFKYSFPEPGDYKITLTGQPKEHAHFTKFNLNYDVNVGTSEAAAQSHEHESHSFWGQHSLHIIIFGGVFAFLIGYLIYDYHKTGKWYKG